MTPPKKTQPARERPGLAGLIKVDRLARSEHLDAMARGELIVYLRLATGAASARSKNRELHKNETCATRSLISLEERGLVRITYERGTSSKQPVRVVELT